ERVVEAKDIARHLAANKAVGVPYTEEMMKAASEDLLAQADRDADTEAFLKRYPNAAARDFDGDPARITEMDALIAYMQMLGTLVDFSQYDAEAFNR
ncbi:MAG: cbb3-type cytochrome c oxidase subunit II, partial [Rhodospirillaceae bacterium]|nr:cbb3-type cytochrome c oxidase subunit II [Rhodospirillaceae bacterium]